MTKKVKFPNKISVFPLSNFIFFPNTNIPLNIFEKRYLEMVNDSMKSSRLIGMIQPKKRLKNSYDQLYDIGCLGKITSFSETEDGRYLIILNVLSRFKIIKEINNEKPYRECEVSFNDFQDDTKINDEQIKFSDLELIFKDLKNLFEKRGYSRNWDELKKQSLEQWLMKVIDNKQYRVKLNKNLEKIAIKPKSTNWEIIDVKSKGDLII